MYGQLRSGKGRLQIKNVKFGLLAGPPRTPPPPPNFFLLFYSNLHPSKHETAFWSTFSPSDILVKLRAKLLNSSKNFEGIEGV